MQTRMVKPNPGGFYQNVLLADRLEPYDSSLMTNADKRRCRATNRRGERCQAHVINAAGYCVAHDPEKPADMRELGKASARARARPNPDRVHS
jgi:hypothetical protein